MIFFGLASGIRHRLGTRSQHLVEAATKALLWQVGCLTTRDDRPATGDHQIKACGTQYYPAASSRIPLATTVQPVSSDSMPHIVESDAADAAEPQTDMICIDEHE